MNAPIGATGLKIRLHKIHLPLNISHGVLARIQGTTDSDPTKSSPSEDMAFYREVLIPAGTEEGRVVPTPPGIFTIQALLPSGQVLQRQTRVAAGEVILIDFESPSAREWLSWQQFEGTGPSRGAMDTRLEFSSSTSTLRHRSASAAPRKRALVAQLRTQSVAGAEASWGAAAHGIGEFRKCLGEEPPERLAQIESEGGVVLWNVPLRGMHELNWVLLEEDKASFVARIPGEWMQRESMGTQAPIQLLYQTATQVQSPKLSVSVLDTGFASLLAYAGRGRLQYGHAIVESLGPAIEEAIAGKAINPLAACLAAYVGLAAFEPGEQERWDSWLPNIMGRFSWLPDGAVVHAQRIMLRPRSRDELGQALAAAKEAYRRGIPCFSMGVLRLRDLLLRFSQQDKEAAKQCELVSAVASRVDPDELFTVIRYSED